MTSLKKLYEIIENLISNGGNIADIEIINELISNKEKLLEDTSATGGSWQMLFRNVVHKSS